MENSIKTKLLEFKQRAYSLLTIQIPEYPSGYNKEKVRNEVIGNIAGKIPEILGISDIIGRRKAKSIATNYLNTNMEKQRRMQRENAVRYANSQLGILVKEIKSFLSTVSVPTRNLTLSGNSYLLIRKMNRLNKYSTPTRRIMELIKVLDEIINMELIENSEITSYIQNRGPLNLLALDLINSLENCLRTMLRQEGRGMFGDNYEDIVPPYIRTRAKKRMLSQEQKESTQGEDLFSYLVFSDYLEIILQENNWECCFSQIFPSKEWIRIKINEIAPIRNSLAHSRKITKDQIDRLRINSGDIKRIIGKAFPC
ncbi:hypothetical protein DMB44_04315 [Thermoplasma sp. Kam2015]|uniref:Swt1 family HEPN domain-containing protein n=1 Tax=Thermoplasma sp. Kam2015 TaxID=2094122 RepID=UPI000D9A687E|nr:Swt1 family HEPN domain-containing protein [Thermoplasma sp. Kam2015]PYB68564.1 hypothetical protein DMB44_04315 [Thermoplasma sp. Kam2015]